MRSVGDKFDEWRAKHKGSLDSMCDAYCAGHVQGDQDAKQRLERALDDIALSVAYCLEENTDADRGEMLTHIGQVAREALRSDKGPS